MAIAALMMLSLGNNLASSLKTVGLLAILLLVFASFNAVLFGFAVRSGRFRELAPFWTASLVFCAISLTGIVLRHDARFFITLYQFFSVVLFFSLAASMRWDRGALGFAVGAMSLIVWFHFALLAAGGFHGSFKGFFTNSNALGAYMALMLFFFAVMVRHGRRKLYWLLAAVMCGAIGYFTETRSVWLLLVTACVFFAGWNFISKSKLRFYATFGLLLAGVLSFIFLYPRLALLDNFKTYNMLMYEYTGKLLLSGREDIWVYLVDRLRDSPWVGFGAGTGPESFAEFTDKVSAHNLYLQIALQTGVLGLCAFLAVLLAVWRLFWNGRDRFVVRLSACFFAAILVHQSFEVTLTQNNMALGLFQWWIAAIGASAAKGEPDRHEHLVHSSILHDPGRDDGNPFV